MRAEIAEQLAAKAQQLRQVKAAGAQHGGEHAATGTSAGHLLSDAESDAIDQALDAEPERPERFAGVPLPNPAQGSSSNGAPAPGPDDNWRRKISRLHQLHDNQPHRQ